MGVSHAYKPIFTKKVDAEASCCVPSPLVPAGGSERENDVSYAQERREENQTRLAPCPHPLPSGEPSAACGLMSALAPEPRWVRAPA